jgi:hypothetical protein
MNTIKYKATGENDDYRWESEGIMMRSPSSGYKVRCWLQRARNFAARKKIAFEALIQNGILPVLLPIIFGYRF